MVDALSCDFVLVTPSSPHPHLRSAASCLLLSFCQPSDVPLPPVMAELFLLADDPTGLRVYWTDVIDDRGSEVGPELYGSEKSTENVLGSTRCQGSLLFGRRYVQPASIMRLSFFHWLERTCVFPRQ